MAGFAHNLPDTIREAELLDLVERLNSDPSVDGILVQLPLPALSAKRSRKPAWKARGSSMR